MSAVRSRREEARRKIVAMYREGPPPSPGPEEGAENVLIAGADHRFWPALKRLPLGRQRIIPVCEAPVYETTEGEEAAQSARAPSRKRSWRAWPGPGLTV